MELSKIVCQLINQGKMEFLEGATKEQIEKFEKCNCVHLPKQYKEWLRYSDGGEFFLPAGVQLYGVAHKPLVDVNDDNKPDDSYIVIGTLASGDPILCNQRGEQISIFNQEAGIIEEDETYEGFFFFLNDLHNILGIGG